MKLVVVGSLALDTVTTPFGARHDVLGGSASYASVAASYFTEVGIVGVVGADFPQEHTQLFAEHGIDCQGLKTESGKTFRWKGRYEGNLSNAITEDTQLNVFETFAPKLPAEAQAADYVFLANIHPQLQQNVRNQAKSNAFVAADTMNLWIEQSQSELLRLLNDVSLFTLNEAEARMLTEEYYLKQAAKQLLHSGPKKLIIKQGEYGALLFAEGKWFRVPAVLLDRLFDPTGAGDTFAGGMMGYLSATGDTSFSGLREAVIFGSVMASFTVEGFSLEKLGKLSRDEIIQRYRSFRESIEYAGAERLPW